MGYSYKPVRDKLLHKLQYNVKPNSYPEKCWTWNLTVLPSNLIEFLTSSVISTHSFCSSADFKNSTLTQRFDTSEMLSCLVLRDTGNWIVTGFKNSTSSLQEIRKIGPTRTSFPSTSSQGTSCTWTTKKNENMTWFQDRHGCGNINRASWFDYIEAE